MKTRLTSWLMQGIISSSSDNDWNASSCNVEPQVAAWGSRCFCDKSQKNMIIKVVARDYLLSGCGYFAPQRRPGDPVGTHLELRYFLKSKGMSLSNYLHGFRSSVFL